ncbi:MAG: AgmX/PglI C-terminal domain-containing protein [Polyangiaceae bacterium]|nr:AgmX/PglI C-terminal domain-containing protein [Polyangiaceae bacterium]
MRRRKHILLGVLTASFLSCAVGPRPPGEPVPAPAAATVIDDPGLSEHAAPAAPFSLTSSDGTGLALVSVDAAATIEDPLALTQLHLVFENPEQRTLEGHFSFTLPEGAAMSRFAMRVRGEWQEAEVVEKQRARVTYEAYLHRRVDPALLEQGAGNEFSVRIFPILPGEKKEIVIAYSETLDSSLPYRLRLAGLPEVGRLTANVFGAPSTGASAKSTLLASLDRTGEVPLSDLTIPPATWSRGEAAAIRSGTAAVVRLRVPADDAAEDPFDGTLIAIDTSASRMLDLGREIAALRSIAQSMPPSARLRIACFDQSVVPVFEGVAGDVDELVLDKIRARRALGASDLGAALAWAKKAAQSEGSARQRLLLFSDGVATAGQKEDKKLAEMAKALGEVGVVRADAIAIGGIRSEATLSAIATGQLPTDGVVAGLDRGIETVTKKLATKTLPPIPVTVPGAKWSYPSSIRVQPGDDVVVFAELASNAAPRVQLGNRTFAPTFANATEPLVRRAIAAAKITDVEREEEPSDAKKKEVVDLSVKNRVVSRYTSMLVLETDYDYQRFGIDRTAKLEVLGLDQGRASIISQDRVVAPSGTGAGVDEGGAPPTPTAPSSRGNLWGSSIGDSFGAGGLGLSGIGEGGGGKSADGVGLGNVGAIGRGAGTGTGQGFGNGTGRLSGSHRSSTPRVRMGATSVSGRLPPEVIQRIVRQNFGRFRLCYENGLRKQQNLEGKVSVRFIIGRDGSVSKAADERSTLPMQSVRDCIVKAFYSLAFPQPESGIVSVLYPIQLSPAGSTSATPTPLPLGTSRARRFLEESQPPAKTEPNAPYSGRFQDIMSAIALGDKQVALDKAWKWRAEEPTNVLSLVALGEASEAHGQRQLAARAYGSILELWSYRVDMRRFAGERLERVGDTSSLALAEYAFAGAVLDRPDHPSGHRLHAMTLLKLGRSEEAFVALESALKERFADGRFGGAREVLKDDLALAAASWIAKEPPERREVIEARARELGVFVERKPSLRFVLVWETDTNDVDLHVTDAKGEHAYYSHPRLESGGVMGPDVTNGYGPEAFSVLNDAGAFAFPYNLKVHYFSRGAMGFGMGKVQVVRHDGNGKVTFEDRPFLMMNDGATIDLGDVKAI